MPRSTGWFGDQDRPYRSGCDRPHVGARQVEGEACDDLVARLRSDAAAAGLDVLDLREAALRVEFDDIAAVVVFLRKVLWTVPDFTVDRYRARLADLHASIETDGPFVCHSQRILFEALKPVN